MESDSERALKYLERAKALMEIAATMKDAKSKQSIVEAAQHFERLAAELTEKPLR